MEFFGSWTTLAILFFYCPSTIPSLGPILRGRFDTFFLVSGIAVVWLIIGGFIHRLPYEQHAKKFGVEVEIVERLRDGNGSWWSSMPPIASSARLRTE